MKELNLKQSFYKKFQIREIATIVVLLVLLFVAQGKAATALPQSLSADYDGSLSDLYLASDGKKMRMYTNEYGNLAARFSFSSTGLGRNLTLKGAIQLDRASDIFSFKVRTPDGFITIGSVTGTSMATSFQLAIPLQAIINGNIIIQIVSRDADDIYLDHLVIADNGTSNLTPLPTAIATPTPTANPTPTATATAVPVPPTSGIVLPPAGVVRWDWQIGAADDSNIVVPAGVVLMDVDGFNTTAAKVAELKAKGVYVVCYINAGSYQPGYPDSNQYPSYLKLQADPDWAGEYFLDVRDVFKENSVLATILRNRFKMCKDKGFNAVEPDNLQNDENIRSGIITTQNQIDFNGWVADNVHAAGLAVFQKNGPDKVLLKTSYDGKMMVDKFDGILNEECQQYNECGPLAEYPKRGKLALNVEYKGVPNCSLSIQLLINTIGKDLDLVGGNMAGYKLLTCP